MKTDASGCFGITVGKLSADVKREPNSLVSKFSDINFAAVYYWMKIEIEEGSTWREVSYAALPSSPYSEVSHNSLTFSGMIAPFAGPYDEEKIPKGWLLCDGRAVSRMEYQNLFNAIGVAWGKGDGSTTFNLPDLRGMFLRGVSENSGNDPDAGIRERPNMKIDGGNTGNNVGSYQGDAIRNITGSIDASSTADNCQAFGETYPTANGALNAIMGWNRQLSDANGGNTMLRGFSFDASKAPNVNVGGDNRPKNVYVTYIIKY